MLYFFLSQYILNIDKLCEGIVPLSCQFLNISSTLWGRQQHFKHLFLWKKKVEKVETLKYFSFRCAGSSVKTEKFRTITNLWIKRLATCKQTINNLWIKTTWNKLPKWGKPIVFSEGKKDWHGSFSLSPNSTFPWNKYPLHSCLSY